MRCSPRPRAHLFRPSKPCSSSVRARTRWAGWWTPFDAPVAPRAPRVRSLISVEWRWGSEHELIDLRVTITPGAERTNVRVQHDASGAAFLSWVVGGIVPSSARRRRSPRYRRPQEAWSPRESSAPPERACMPFATSSHGAVRTLSSESLALRTKRPTPTDSPAHPAGSAYPRTGDFSSYSGSAARDALVAKCHSAHMHDGAVRRSLSPFVARKRLQSIIRRGHRVDVTFA